MRMLVLSTLLLSACVTPLRHLTPEGATRLVSDDDTATVTVEPIWRGFKIAVTNKVDQRIRVEWNEAVFVEPDGKSDPLILGSTLKINLGKPMPPGVLYPKASITETVLPRSLAGKSSSRMVLIPDAWIGRPWRVVVPLYVDGSAAARLYEIVAVSTPDPKP
jgi:hypothetical protein